MELPECFQKDRRWQTLLKFGSTVLIGKNKLKFPVNLPNVYEHSKYIQTLFEATDANDLSTVTLLVSYDITYENDAFLAVWGRFNLPGNGDWWLENNKTDRVSFLLECRTYLLYFGFPLIEVVDDELYHTKLRSFKVLPELQAGYDMLITMHEENLVKNNFRKFLRMNTVIAGNKLEELRFHRKLFKSYNYVFEPYSNRILAAIEQLFPNFQVMFYDMVEEIIEHRDAREDTPGRQGDSDYPRWLSKYFYLRALPREKPYNISMWFQNIN